MTAATDTAVETKRLNYLAAIREAQIEEMERDESVILLGEDCEVGVFGTTDKLDEQFGTNRVRTTPVSENGFAGAGIGAAMTGLRPIIDLTIAAFVYVSMDQLVSQAAKNRYMFGGQARIPIVFRAAMLYGGNAGAHHSDRPYPLFMNTPGLKVAVPASPADAKGLLKTAVRDDNPIMFFEDQTLWSQREEVPTSSEFLIPFGQAAVKREGSDVTLVAIAGSVPRALKAAKLLERDGISVEVIDPRTLVPLDWDTILASVEKTGRLVVADPAHLSCSAASEILATVAERAFSSLRVPPLRVTTPDMNVPFAPSMLVGFYPDPDRIAAGVRKVVDHG
ncbi:MAG: alpha-ketoacid dehydrogenase subunit beta [Solirubrobacterales bacterium]|nr:alpha-ketoacid dehydrogenase subunit beta [Solirubrobacterales bacterium]